MMCNKDLYYIPIAVSLLALVWELIRYMPTFMYQFMYMSAPARPQNLHIQGLQQLGAGGGVAPISQAVYNNYMSRLNRITPNDNQYIVAATNVNPDDRLIQEYNIHALSDSMSPIQGTPEIDTESGGHLNLDRNIGNFRIPGTNQFSEALEQQRLARNQSYYNDTSVPRNYLLAAAENKVRRKNQAEKAFPSHKWFHL